MALQLELDGWLAAGWLLLAGYSGRGESWIAGAGPESFESSTAAPRNSEGPILQRSSVLGSRAEGPSSDHEPGGFPRARHQSIAAAAAAAAAGSDERARPSVSLSA
jgi:hypothetical protein